VYRGEFDLPKSHAGPLHRAKWAPCPCCHPETAWYWQKGKIAWFPQESVIRNIGRDCFKNINAAGHEEAVQEFRRDERKRQNRDYLLAHLGSVPQAVRVIEQAMPAISAIDTVRRILSQRLTKIIGFDIWNAVRGDGTLKIQGQRTEHFVNADGVEGTRQVGFIQPYGPLRGYVMLNPDAKPLEPRLAKELSKLRTIDFGVNFAERLEAMNDDERQDAANSLGKPIATAKTIFEEANECRRFLSAESIATLNGWGRHEQSSARVYLKLDTGFFWIGRTEETASKVQLAAFFDGFGELPNVGNAKDI
jgi:hypothetical protein